MDESCFLRHMDPLIKFKKWTLIYLIEIKTFYISTLLAVGSIEISNESDVVFFSSKLFILLGMQVHLKAYFKMQLILYFSHSKNQSSLMAAIPCLLDLISYHFAFGSLCSIYTKVLAYSKHTPILGFCADRALGTVSLTYPSWWLTPSPFLGFAQMSQRSPNDPGCFK